MKKKLIEFVEDHTPPVPVLVIVLSFSAILGVAIGLGTPAPNVMAATITGLSPATEAVCNCVPPDISKSLEQMSAAVSVLNDQLRAAETRETDAQAELAKAQAEIERLQNPTKSPCRHMAFAYGGLVCDD